MTLPRAISAILLAFALALGSVIGVASATKQAFANPCPMHDQGTDGPCCKGNCTVTMTGCSVKCSVPPAIAAPQGKEAMCLRVPVPRVSWACDSYDPFIAGPPPPIPIV